MIDVKNKRFQSLTAIEPVGKLKNGSIVWLCKCDCGAKLKCDIQSLKNRHSKKCRNCWQQNVVEMTEIGRASCRERV